MRVRKPGVELRAAAAGLGEDEAALLDVVAEVLLAERGEFGGLVAVEEEDGGLQQVLDGGDVGVDDLPGEQVLPVSGDDADEVADVVVVVIPVAPGGVAGLLMRTGGSAFGQKQKGEAGGDGGLVFDGCPGRPTDR